MSLSHHAISDAIKKKCPETLKKYYENFKNLPTSQKIVLGLAAYNALVGAAVGGSYFVIANAAAREYLFDAALHFLNTSALISNSKLLNAIAFTGNFARMFQIDKALDVGVSTVSKTLNFVDSIWNHPASLFGFGVKWFGSTNECKEEYRPSRKLK